MWNEFITLLWITRLHSLLSIFFDRFSNYRCSVDHSSQLCLRVFLHWSDYIIMKSYHLSAHNRNLPKIHGNALYEIYKYVSPWILSKNISMEISFAFVIAVIQKISRIWLSFCKPALNPPLGRDVMTVV